MDKNRHSKLYLVTTTLKLEKYEKNRTQTTNTSKKMDTKTNLEAGLIPKAIKGPRSFAYTCLVYMARALFVLFWMGIACMIIFLFGVMTYMTIKVFPIPGILLVVSFILMIGCLFTDYGRNNIVDPVNQFFYDVIDF